MEVIIKLPKQLNRLHVSHMERVIKESFCGKCLKEINGFAVNNRLVDRRTDMDCWCCHNDECGVHWCDECRDEYYHSLTEEEQEEMDCNGFYCKPCNEKFKEEENKPNCENERCEKKAEEVREYANYTVQVCKECYEELKELEEQNHESSDDE